MVSAALELGSTLAKKGCGAFFLVFSCSAQCKERSLDQQAFIQACVRSSVYRFNGEFHALGSVGADLLEDSFRADDKAAARHDFIDEANAISFICPDNIAGKNELQGPAFTHQPGKALCTAVARHDSYFHFRLAEFRRFAGQAGGAGHCQFAAAAQSVPVYRSDHRLTQVLDQSCESLSQTGLFFRFKRSIVEHLADVCSRSECFVAGPGKDHTTYCGIVTRSLKGCLQLRDHALIQGIEHLGAVKSYIGYGTFRFVDNICKS